ncbi:MAG: HipA family kinase [Dehalococcoidia bacterium]
MRRVEATRYVTPLREGGSLPALIEADDDGLYVLKFRGAGQGPKALVAELLAGEIGRALGLPIPEIVFIDLDPILGRAEADPEIKALIEASGGLNLGLDFLPGSLALDHLTAMKLEPGFGARVVWFDALVTNVDRSARNTNMLMWHREPWLIDHGASLYFHHDWPTARPESPFPAIAKHVLLPRAASIGDVSGELASRLPPELLHRIVSLVPDDWLQGDASPDEIRQRYVDYLTRRLAARDTFVEEADRARQDFV